MITSKAIDAAKIIDEYGNEINVLAIKLGSVDIWPVPSSYELRNLRVHYSDEYEMIRASGSNYAYATADVYNTISNVIVFQNVVLEPEIDLSDAFFVDQENSQRIRGRNLGVTESATWLEEIRVGFRNDNMGISLISNVAVYQEANEIVESTSESSNEYRGVFMLDDDMMSDGLVVNVDSDGRGFDVYCDFFSGDYGLYVKHTIMDTYTSGSVKESYTYDPTHEPLSFNGIYQDYGGVYLRTDDDPWFGIDYDEDEGHASIWVDGMEGDTDRRSGHLYLMHDDGIVMSIILSQQS